MKIFFSYSRRDQLLAERILASLEAAGHSVWFDRQDIGTGDLWREKIAAAIAEADRFVILVTEHSVQSDHVRRELDLAADRSIPISPLRVGQPNVPPSMNYNLVGLQYLELDADPEATLEKLGDAVERPAAADLKRARSADKSRPIEARVLVLGCLAVVVIGAVAVTWIAAKDQAGADVVTSLTAYAALCGLVFAAFHGTESLLRKDVLNDIGRWLYGASRFGSADAWMTGFINIFDTVFKVRRVGSRLLIPGVFRSLIASTCCVVVLYLFYQVLGNHFDWSTETPGLMLWLQVLTLSLTFNFIPDYVSLAETRYIMARIDRSQSVGGTAFLLVVDILFTLLIAFVGSAVANLLYPVVDFLFSGFDWSRLRDWNIPFAFTQLIETYRRVLMIDGTSWLREYSDAEIDALCGVYIYSTFLTSVWLWLFALSGALLRLLSRIDRFRSLLFETFRTADRPLAVIGWMTIVLVSVIYWSTYLYASTGEPQTAHSDGIDDEPLRRASIGFDPPAG